MKKIRGGPFLAPACRHVLAHILGVGCFVSETLSEGREDICVWERQKWYFFFVKKGHIFPFIVGRDKSTQKDVYLLYTHLHVHAQTHTAFSWDREFMFSSVVCVFSQGSWHLCPVRTSFRRRPWEVFTWYTHTDMHPHIDTHTHTHTHTHTPLFCMLRNRVFFSKDISLDNTSNFYLVLNPIERTFCLSVCARVLCVCVCWGEVCVCERETEIDTETERKKQKTTETERDRDFFFLPEKKITDIYFSFHGKKDPMQKHFFTYSSLICTFLKEQDVQGSPCSVGGVAQAPPLQWVLQAGMVVSPLCSCFSCASEWAPRASQGWCRGDRAEQDQNSAKHHPAPQNSIWWTYLQSRNRPTDMRNKCMATKGERGGEG